MARLKAVLCRKTAGRPHVDPHNLLNMSRLKQQLEESPVTSTSQRLPLSLSALKMVLR